MSEEWIGYSVKVYQHFDDEPENPFTGEIIEDFSMYWMLRYKAKNKRYKERRVNKACCSSKPFKMGKKNVRRARRKTSSKEKGSDSSS